MKKKLTGVLAAAVGVLALVAGGATFAEFGDTEAGAEASGTAGTLDLVLDNGPGTPSPGISLTDVAPSGQPPVAGTSGDFYLTKLSNVGSLAGTVRWRFIELRSFENGCSEAEAGDGTCGTEDGAGELASQLQVVFSLLDANCQGVPVPVSTLPLMAGSTTPFRPLAGPGQPAVTLDAMGGPNATRCVRADLFLPSGEFDDLTQSDSASFRFMFRLAQST